VAETILTNRNKPLGLYKRGGGGGLSPADPSGSTGTFSVVPMPTLPSTPAPTETTNQTTYQRQMDHKRRIIEYGLGKNRPAREINSILRMYGYDKLKASTTTTKRKTLKDASGVYRYADTKARVFPGVAKKGRRSKKDVVKDIRMTAGAIATKLGNQSLTDAILRTTIKDPKVLAALDKGKNKDPYVKDMVNSLDFYKKEYQGLTGQPFGGTPATPAPAPKGSAMEGLIAGDGGLVYKGKKYAVNPDNTVVIDGKRYRVNR